MFWTNPWIQVKNRIRNTIRETTSRGTSGGESEEPDFETEREILQIRESDENFFCCSFLVKLHQISRIFAPKV